MPLSIIKNIANRERMEIFFTILIMTLVVSLSGVFTRVLPFQLPLPLMQIAIGAADVWFACGIRPGTLPGAVYSAAAVCGWLENADP